LLESGTSSTGFLLFGDSGDQNIGSVSYNHSDNSMRFETNDSERLRIDSSGNVGIGTDAPSSNLHVLGDSARLERSDNAFALQLYNNNASPADGAALGFLQFLGKDNNGTANIVHSEVRGGVQSNTDSSVSGYLSFLTTNNATSVTEAMRIDASGNVGIGTDSPKVRLQSSGAGTANAPSLGSVSSNVPLYLTGSNKAFGLVAGTNSSTGHSWLQAQRTDGTATAYNITLNEAGGNVGIGTASPTAPLQVQGDGIGIKLDGSSNTTKSIFFRQTNSSNPAQVYADGSLRLFTEDNGTDIRFHVNSDGSSNEKLRINATGVGIGTASPSVPLEVKDSQDSSLDSGIAITRSAAAQTGYINMVGGAFNLNTPDGHAIKFRDGGTTNMTILGTGNVGIGTDNPTVGKLQVNDGSGAIVAITRTSGATSGNLGVLRFGNTDVDSNLANISAIQDGSTTSSALTFETQSTGGATAERLRIDSSGSLLVGGTALAQADSFGVDSNGVISSSRASSASVSHVLFYNGSPLVGFISTSTTATQYVTSSDYRLKENETNLIDGIDRLKQLSPYRFNFKVDPDKKVDGFFAHEVSDVVPEAITGTKDGMKDEEYEVSPAVYEDVVHPAVDAVYEDVVHPATYEEVVHPAVEATYDEDGNELTPATEEYTEQVLLTEEYTEQVLVTEAVEEYTESVLVTEAVMDTRSVPDYQGIDQAKLVPLLTAALQEAVAKIEALEARVQTLEG